jgi:hypothetical protein
MAEMVAKGTTTERYAVLKHMQTIFPFTENMYDKYN